jgi:hypothetical protein
MCAMESLAPKCAKAALWARLSENGEGDGRIIRPDLGLSCAEGWQNAGM